MQAVSLVVLVVAVASLNERVVELLVKPLVQLIIKSEKGAPIVVKYLSVATALLLSWGFGLDVFTPLLESYGATVSAAWFGWVVTGILMGLGSNVAHELLGRLAGDESGRSPTVTSGIGGVL